MLFSITVFGVTFPTPAPPQEPTPLEVAEALLVGAQHALIAAQSEQERADANVAMFRARIARLTQQAADLRPTEQQISQTLRRAK